jgi:hypothetical protein
MLGGINKYLNARLAKIYFIFDIGETFPNPLIGGFARHGARKLEISYLYLCDYLLIVTSWCLLIDRRLQNAARSTMFVEFVRDAAETRPR